MQSNSKEIFLENVPELLRKASKESDNIPKEIADFCVYISELADENLTPAQLYQLVIRALDDICFGIADFKLSYEFYEIMQHITCFSVVIREIANKDFSNKFEELFCKRFGKVKNTNNKNKDYGVLTLGNNLVNISNKNKAEVLASLYNNANSKGLCFSHYDPKPMDIKEAKKLLENFTYFGYLPGHLIQVDLSNNVIDVTNYNENNGVGAAEKAISFCRNIK